MTIETRKKKVEKMIYTGLKNLFERQDNLSLDNFSITILHVSFQIKINHYDSLYGASKIGANIK